MTAQGKKLLMFVKKLIVNLFICLVNPNNEASHSYIDIENNYILKDTKYFYFFMERAMKPAGCL
jgi:hypothetical protein